MRAGWLLVAGLIILGAPSSLWAGPFTEVPSDHWAYRACARLATIGMLPEDRSATFSGNPTITRFEFGIALLDPLSAVDQSLSALPASADDRGRLRAALDALRISPRYSEEQIADGFSDLRRLAVEFSDVLTSMSFDPTRVSRSLSRLADRDGIRIWRLESLARPNGTTALRSGAVPDILASDTVHVPLAHGMVGVSLTNPQDSPELLDYLASSVAADRSREIAASGAADPSLTDPRVSRLRTSYEYGLGSALTLSLAYEEIARRGQGVEPFDAASLTSLGIGYQLTPSTSLKLSYSLLEYSNYALDTPLLRDRVAETAVSIEF
jgi:hypothetical protein